MHPWALPLVHLSKIACTIPLYFVVHEVFYNSWGRHIPEAVFQKLLDKPGSHEKYIASCRLNPACVLRSQLFGVSWVVML